MRALSDADGVGIRLLVLTSTVPYWVTSSRVGLGTKAALRMNGCTSTLA